MPCVRLPVLHHVRVEEDLAVRGWRRDRRPEVPAFEVTQVDSEAGAVAGRIGAPACQCEGIPLAAATAALGHHDAVMTVRQDVNLRKLGIERDRPWLHRRVRAHRDPTARRFGARLFNGRTGHGALEQQRLGGLRHRLRVETSHHGIAVQQVVQCDEDHSLVMRHEGANDRWSAVRPLARRRAVDRLVQAVASHQAELLQTIEVLQHRMRRDAHSERARIGSDHQIIFEAPLETEVWNTEGSILVVLVCVELVESRLRDAPGHSPPPRVGDLLAHDGPAGPPHHAVGTFAQQQRRHQVLEHGAAPGEQRVGAAHPSERAAQVQPVFFRNIAFGDRHEARQARLRSQQIVVVIVYRVRRRVVADVEDALDLVLDA